ncbi:hypothetical protein OJAV_G00054050 [Oryzias javanicus]|uniref:UPAR/Ly6 domain-containing protein n=1 Tax=Oryzias javanicus TaxID=123683 RepID=A0A3S2N1X2_ORYJA|nr:hypothetical protein OJAV_G00054050 [Oryzias javanicus]
MVYLCLWVHTCMNSRIWGQLLWLLASILLVSGPASALEHLLCNICPLHEKSELCSNFTTECLPGERCASSRGFYGALHVLSAQGCVSADLCGSYEMVTFRGIKYKVRHTCCCQNVCNEAPESKTTLKELLQMIKAKANDTEAAVEERPLDVCANSTRTETTAAPAIKA